MTPDMWTWTGLSLSVMVITALYVITWKLAYKDGWDAGREYEAARGYWKQIRANRAADRRRPRELSPAPWPATAPPRPARVVTTAGDRAPVTVVPVGPARIPLAPQPSRISGAGTVALAAVTSTGEMRRLTDEFIAELAAQGERDRRELTS